MTAAGPSPAEPSEVHDRQLTSTYDLLIQLKAERDEAIEVLYPRYSKQFYWYARHKGLSREDAEDVVMITFGRILTRIKTFDEVQGRQGAGAPWLWMIHRNVVIDHLRGTQRTRGTRSLDEHPLEEDVKLNDGRVTPEDIDPARSAENRELSRALECAWSRISAADQDEFRRGPGGGTGRKTWHQAVERFRIELLECARSRISAADQDEIRQGPGGGTGRRAWHQAVERFRIELNEGL